MPQPRAQFDQHVAKILNFPSTLKVQARRFGRVDQLGFPVSILLLLGFILGADGILVVYRIASGTHSDDYFLLFWLAMLCALGPMTYVGMQRATSEARRIIVLGGIGLFTFLPKLFLNPNAPRYFDEYGHYRNALEIIRRGSLFPSDSYLPIDKYFPGLGGATDLLHFVTGLSVWHSGLVVVGISHCASLIVVYGLARTLGLSSRPSFLAALVFGTNASFLYFDTEFSYESLGLTLALLAILCTARVRRTPSKGWVLGGIIAAVGCAVTHHVASVFMAVACLLIAAVMPPGETASQLLKSHFDDPWEEEAAEERARRRAVVFGWLVAAAAIAAPAAWLTTVATPTYNYVEPHIRAALAQLPYALHLAHAHTPPGVAGASKTRQLFYGSGDPAYERIAAFAAPVIVLVVVLAVAWACLRRTRSVPKFRALALPLALAALYLASLPVTLTASGGESAHRSWAYTYVGVGILGGVALGLGERWLARKVATRRGWAAGALALGLAVLLIGNVASGTDINYRFPGPYLFGSDTRSDSPSLNAVIAWLNSHAPIGAGVVCDRSTGEYVEAFTRLDVPKPSDYNVYKIYEDGDQPSAALRSTLRRGGFEYFILDTTIETRVPAAPFFEGYHRTNLNVAALEAMHNTTFTTVLYRTGPYIVFRLHP